MNGRGIGRPAQDERIGIDSPPSYVIPSVAEESKNLEMESRAGISDSSATLGMTSFNKFRMNGKGGRLRMNGLTRRPAPSAHPELR